MSASTGETPGTEVRWVHSAAELEHEAVGWRVSPVSAAPRFGTMRRWRGRRARYAEYTGGGLAFTRGQESHGDALHPYLQLTFVREGRLTVTHDGRTEVCEPGAVVAFRMDHTYEAIAEVGLALAMLLVPIDIIEARGVDSRRVTGTIWDAGALDEEVARMARRTAEMPRETWPAMESALMELTLGMLAARDHGGEDDVTAQSRARVMRIIDELYTRADLDATAIARSLGVSRRYLYTLFEGRDVSVAALIRNRRVLHAEELLSGDDDLPLRRVAQLCGLGSEDRLLRTFKATLGVSPSEYRRNARRQAVVEREALADEAPKG